MNEDTFPYTESTLKQKFFFAKESTNLHVICSNGARNWRTVS
jgi:hypothetical protein